MNPTLIVLSIFIGLMQLSAIWVGYINIINDHKIIGTLLILFFTITLFFSGRQLYRDFKIDTRDES